MIALAAFVIIVAGMRAAETIIVPFLLSVFIAIISSPFMFLLQRKGVPTFAAILIMALVILAFGGILAAIVGTSVNQFTKELPRYQEAFQTQRAQLVTWLETKGIEVSNEMLTKYLNPGAIMSMVANLLSQLGAILANSFLIFITVIFILMEASIVPDKISAAMNRPKESLRQLETIAKSIKRYLAIKTVTSLITGAIITLILVILKIDYPFLWGLLAFLLNYVPNIGSILAAIPAILLALIDHGITSAILTSVGYIAVNTTIGNFVEPRVMGRGLGLSTLVVFLSLVFWGWVLGPVGMLLSVPLTMTLKVALESYSDTRWVAIMLGSEPLKSKKMQ
jgi:predicted PurR-regulated permease PerM